MLTEKSVERLIKKVDRLIPIYEDYAYRRVSELDAEIFETAEFRNTPPLSGYRPISKGDTWGKPFSLGWFKITIPARYVNKRLFLEFDTGAVEHLVFLNGTPVGATDVVRDAQTPQFRLHRFAEITVDKPTNIYAEGYASHVYAGCSPTDRPTTFALNKVVDFNRFEGIGLFERNDEIWRTAVYLRFLSAAYADRTLKEEARKELEEIYLKAFELLPAFPEEKGTERAEEACRICNRFFGKRLPQKKDKNKFPLVALIGHAHMDTVWLWDTDETKRKIARTVINALNLMKRYPEYKFIMSSTLHYEWLKEEYPALFEEVKRFVKEGRFEPNGGSYVECDANLASGEAMIRQFLYGFKFNRENFDYEADVYWLPDTFGYSAAIPQILKGFGMTSFMTTKINVNDTNRFPHDNFIWRGIDGSETLCSFNILQCYPDNATINERYDYIADKDRFAGTLISYGFGDGGGGPDESMVEIARLCSDSALTPNVGHATVSEFCKTVAAYGKDLPVYEGELYFESHRGTFTTLSGIKRYNRKLEFALSNVEKLISSNGCADLKEEFARVYKILLLNQFHDVLPGTSIDEVNVNVFKRYEEAFSALDGIVKKMGCKTDKRFAYNFNDFKALCALDLPFGGEYFRDCACEVYDDLDGNLRLKGFGFEIEGFGKKELSFTKEPRKEDKNYFSVSGKEIKTPYYDVLMNGNGEIAGLYDKKSKRELIKKGGSLNRFAAFEDVPLNSDNWDIDEDVVLKEIPAATLLSTRVVCDKLHLRLRSEYRLCDCSKLYQDTVFYSDSPRVDFETKVDWAEKHTLLKTYFDTAIDSDTFVSEIQFGRLSRSTRRNTDIEKAKHEVCQHKWSDLSDGVYGLAVLNDCKYGVNCEGGKIGLTLFKSGTHPDTTGDKGVHYFRYALLPHTGDASAEAVVRPAYLFNNPVVISDTDVALSLPVANRSEECIMETVKPAEDGNGLVVRCFNSSDKRSGLELVFDGEREIRVCDMAERESERFPKNTGFSRELGGFEILTLKIL